MTEKHPQIGTGVVVFNKKGQILMGKRTYKPLGYSLPGGHLEFGETLEQCAIREVKEEVGIDIKQIEIITFGENLFLEKDYHSISIFIFSTIKEGEIVKNMEPHKCDGWSWFNIEELPKQLSFNYEPILKENLALLKKYKAKI